MVHFVLAFMLVGFADAGQCTEDKDCDRPSKSFGCEGRRDCRWSYKKGPAVQYGDNAETRCIFPFTYWGQTYDACSNIDTGSPGYFWCPTQMPKGESVFDKTSGHKWGYCNIKRANVRSTHVRKDCVFPFMYKSSVMYTCVGYMGYTWCPTNEKYRWDVEAGKGNYTPFGVAKQDYGICATAAENTAQATKRTGAMFNNLGTNIHESALKPVEHFVKELGGETSHLSRKLLAQEKLKVRVLLAANPDFGAAKLAATISRLRPEEANLATPEQRNLLARSEQKRLQEEEELLTRMEQVTPEQIRRALAADFGAGNDDEVFESSNPLEDTDDENEPRVLKNQNQNSEDENDKIERRVLSSEDI